MIIHALHKKIIPVIIIVLLLCAGIIALTQEMEEIFSDYSSEDLDNFKGFDIGQGEAEIERHTRWFRSNAGGMAIEEMKSRYAALRCEYALAIDIARYDEIPEYILPFYQENFIPEIRILFKRGELRRTQWILRDNEKRTRVNAVFYNEAAEDDEDIEQIEDNNEYLTESNEELTRNDEELAESSDQSTESIEQLAESLEPEEEFLEIVRSYYKEGFVEIYDEKSSLISEYRFFENGNRNKIDYEYNQDLIIVSTVMDWSAVTKRYSIAYKDFYFYNRSLSLRSIERKFFKNIPIDDDTILITFPRRIMNILNDSFIESQKLNLYPEFFGNILVQADTKIIYENDERGRVLKQTYYNENDEIVWVIENIWSNDRIVSTIKTEGDIELIAEYEYDSNGERTIERNLRNGMLERVVFTDDKTDIEELYFNNVLVLRAVWEDGRKISETRIR